jgi:hypothetical protein
MYAQDDDTPSDAPSGCVRRSLGMVTSFTAGGLIHIVLAVGLVVLVTRLIQGRRILG